nr:ribonuclease H-like domain-containing protein [Tanacetum cinerariifolium]
MCPLTRIATATIVPPREPIPIVKSMDKPVVTLVYTRKPKAKNVPNQMEPNKSWGFSSNVSTSPTDCRRIQELLMILLQTCPYLTDIGTKLEAVTPKNKTKQIRHTAQVTKSESITVTILPSTNLESNKPVLSSTGVNLLSSASGSLSQDNTKNNRIRKTQKNAKKNKAEDHLRTVISSLNKASVVDSKAISSVLNSVSNMNFDLKCASCNGCLFSDNHDACAVDYINSVNASKKLGNVCPLTRIATPTIVPPRKPIPIVNSTGKPVVTLVYSRKPKSMKVSNKMEPNNSWGSLRSNVPSLLFACRLSKSSSACAMGKSTKKTQKPKSEDTNQEKLYLLYMDLCGPMHIESVIGKKYILVIMDDYSRFTWVKFLRSKDETPTFIIKFLKMIQ